MPHYYVQHDGKWNVFSTIVDDFLLAEFLSFEDLKRWVLDKDRIDRERELDTLLTDNPELNVMTYSEAIVDITIRVAGEQWKGDDDEFDRVINKLHKEWVESGTEVHEFVEAVHNWLKVKVNT